ncbi:uncharacterized protein O3C94_002692 [Discoglossus pictus]
MKTFQYPNARDYKRDDSRHRLFQIQLSEVQENLSTALNEMANLMGSDEDFCITYKKALLISDVEQTPVEVLKPPIMQDIEQKPAETLDPPVLINSEGFLASIRRRVLKRRSLCKKENEATSERSQLRQRFYNLFSCFEL